MTPNPDIEWYQSLDGDPEFLAEEAKIGFAVCLERRLLQKDMSKTDFSRRIGKTPSYVTKILRGDSNLTIKTMVELADAVDSALHLHIAPRKAAVRWFEIVEKTPVAGITSDDERRAASIWVKYASQGTRDYVTSAA